jgi:hypothetical protein
MTIPKPPNWSWFTLLCVCVLCIAGCYTRRAPAKPVVNFVAPVRPVLPQMRDIALSLPPDIEATVPETPEIVEEPVQPAKPHVPVPVAQEPASTQKHVEPTIAPEVPTEEVIAAKVQTEHSLDVAEKGLGMAQGKNLNPTQQDLVSKVRGFADNAREAMRTGDWERAKNLAKKAEVLSEELAASL